MTFDSVVMAAVADELNKKLLNGRVDKIQQPSPLDVILAIRSNGANYSLLISADAQSPRIHLASTKQPNPKTPPNFCMLLRKHLEGSRFSGAEQVDFDRILRLKFDAYDGERITLIVEIMGKHSNAILVNGTDRILGAVKPVGKSKNRYREILSGRQYVPPPSQNKINPLNVIGTEFEISEAALKTFTGMSPFAARELVARCEGDLGRLREVFTEFFGNVRSGEFSPVLITDDAGQTIGFYPFPSVQHPASNQHERPSISAAADVFYTSTLPREVFDQAKVNFISRIRKELESQERTVLTIQESITDCEGAERIKQIGELILSQMASIPQEAATVELVDYYDPNSATIEVKLDPQLTASENAEAYFKRYHKLVSGTDTLQDRLVEANKEIDLLHKLLGSADSITSEDQIENLTKTLESQDIHIRKQEESIVEKRKAEFDGHKISRVVSNGWEILVGQNSEANDYLLTRLAKPNDLWLHVKASSSAHVVIRTNNKPETVPKSVLHAAAELAAKNSDSKHSSLVPVDYTLKKYVRKQKGASAGKALYQNEKTIFVTPK